MSKDRIVGSCPDAVKGRNDKRRLVPRRRT